MFYSKKTSQNRLYQKETKFEDASKHVLRWYHEISRTTMKNLFCRLEIYRKRCFNYQQHTKSPANYRKKLKHRLTKTHKILITRINLPHFRFLSPFPLRTVKRSYLSSTEPFYSLQFNQKGIFPRKQFAYSTDALIFKLIATREVLSSK